MSILAWIILGLLSGFIASKIVNRRGEGALLDIVLGVAGSVVGGLAFNVLGAVGVTGLRFGDRCDRGARHLPRDRRPKARHVVAGPGAEHGGVPSAACEPPP